MKRTVRRLGLAIALCLATSAGTLAQTHLRVGLADDPDMLDPTLARSYTARIVFASICDKLRAQKLDKLIQRKTGLVVDAYFSATKVQWILQNVKGAKAHAAKGELAFGTVDSWLIYKLTGAGGRPL